MQQNREFLSNIKYTNKPSFLQRDILKAHKDVVKQFKFKARNENAVNINEAMDSMRSTLYKLIRNNRNNAT